MLLLCAVWTQHIYLGGQESHPRVWLPGPENYFAGAGTRFKGESQHSGNDGDGMNGQGVRMKVVATGDSQERSL